MKVAKIPVLGALSVAACIGLRTMGTAALSDYSTVFYQSGELKIEAYLYKPAGDGPFPLVIYNHGNRTGGQERLEQPSPGVGQLLTNAGYAVFVPERRGFGKSEGPTVTQDLEGSDRNERQVRRSQAEADDVLAAVDFLKSDASINVRQLALLGYSLGGQVSLFAASRSNAFVALIDQAGGSLSWNGNPVLQRAMLDAAGKLRIPTLGMVAENDATTEAVKRVYAAARASGSRAELIVYPPFTPSSPSAGTPPGHLIFRPEGIRIWGADVVSFLRRHVHQ
jgi:dienelactone hydrolase